MTIPAPYKRYNGGKAGQGTYQKIINFIPPCEEYYELMVGNGGIVRNLLLPCFVWINDLDKTVIDKWNVVLKKNRMYRNGNFIVTNKDAIQLLEQLLEKDRTSFIYLDPPYKHETRKGGSTPLYKFEWQTKDHIKFLKLVHNCTCSVMISHPKDELYSKYLKGWYTFDFQSMTSQGLMWDRIWMNYPPPVLRQDYRYLGKNYREREIISRKVKRHVAKINALPEVQQVAILSALIKQIPAAVPLAMQIRSITTKLPVTAGT